MPLRHSILVAQNARWSLRKSFRASPSIVKPVVSTFSVREAVTRSQNNSKDTPKFDTFHTKWTKEKDSLPYHIRRPIAAKVTGKALLTDSLFNKGSAFGSGERDRLGIRGLLPSRELSMENQINRVLKHLDMETSPIRKYLYLRDLHDRNETLFHRVLVDHIEELAPIVYTPTVGLACQKFGHDYRRARGMYFCHHDHGDMGGMMYNWPQDDVWVIVVTDGSRILGLGDLGANGMGIPIGKLALYCAAGGLAPHRVLPMMFDAGTNNEELLEDPYYMGLQHRRLDGDQYFELLDELMSSIKNRWPHCLVQFEDFSSDKAMRILHRYRDQQLCFNDDIQGTGAVAVAGILSAIEQSGLPRASFRDQRFMIAGAGSAGLGVANALCDALVLEGMTEEDAASRFWICDINGVINPNSDVGDAAQRFVRTDSTAGMSLAEAVDVVQPTALLGLSACHGLFTSEIIRSMATFNDRPIIFPLSNPTENAECTAEDVYRISEGKAIFASGSPFSTVTLDGRKFTPSQCNNMFVFPGLGLGANLARASCVSDKMIYEAAIALSQSLTSEERQRGQIFPSVNRIREVSKQVACAVILQAVEEGQVHETTLDRMPRLSTPGALSAYVHRKMYDPVYVPIV
eukprot:m.696351 g.696351  ORF g.696351 m.696351 type:complete len:630 (+) comp22892_c1_seq18:300-2189(+)